MTRKLSAGSAERRKAHLDQEWAVKEAQELERMNAARLRNADIRTVKFVPVDSLFVDAGTVRLSPAVDDQ
ncbi:hypothetical protein [Tateyamaria sp. SN3-11]|uniref:hypothetical protein n=1 Tax=Tateyamaria sp. SN3-11 TaxID=3092147 RepID=UPI0039E99E52